MGRNYRRCGGCHFPQPYCDCKDYGVIDFDTKNAVTSNKLCLAYQGTKVFGYSVTTSDGVEIKEPQFQGLAFDGTYVYMSICNGDQPNPDEDGCIIRMSSDGSIYVGPVINQIGHAKLGYDFKTHKLIVARRLYAGDWGDAYAFEVDPDSLAVTAFNEMSHQIISFVQNDKDLYYIDASADHLYKINSIDVATGAIDRELIATLPLPGDYYPLLGGNNNGMQTWAFDGRTVMCIRNNPQFAFFYDTVTKRTIMSHIGNVSDGRFIGELEASYTWNGETIFMSACDISDHLTDSNGNTFGEHYAQFWSYHMIHGSSGSIDVRENTHPTYDITTQFWGKSTPPVDTDNTTNKNIIYNADMTNLYCNGSQKFPFHSIHEALAYLREHPTAKGIQIQSNFDGFIRAANINCDFTRKDNTVSVNCRFALCENVRFVLSDFVLHDCEFYDSYVFLRSNNSLGTSVYTNIPENNLWNGVVLTIGVTGQNGSPTLKSDIQTNDKVTDTAFIDCVTI